MSVPGVFVALASSGRKVDIRWSLSLPALMTNVPVGMCATMMVETGPDRARNREVLAEKALESGARYLFMLDDDTICPNTTLKLLTYEIEKDPKIMIAGGIYCTKEALPNPLVFKRIGDGSFWNWKAGDVFDCEGLATGCMLVKTEMLKAIPKPWFLEPYETPTDETMKIGADDIPVTHRSGTDDLYFCRKVVDAGFRIVAHGGVLPLHMDQNGILFGLPSDSYPMRNGPNIDRALSTEGWMQPDELSYLASEASKSQVIIEVGSWLGRSTCALAANTPGEVIAIDTWEGSNERFRDAGHVTSHSEILKDKGKDWLYSEFRRNTRGLPVTPIRSKSLEAAEHLRLSGKQADLIFIDASHDYESVKADIEAWMPLLAPGGIICGHDFGDEWPGVKRAVTEMIPDFGIINKIWTTRRAA